NVGNQPPRAVSLLYHAVIDCCTSIHDYVSTCQVDLDEVAARVFKLAFREANVPICVSERTKPVSCTSDHECAEDEFCYGSRGACVPCRKRKKRCVRDAVCCPGNYCSNGVCTPIDFDTTHGAGTDAVLLDSFGHENSTSVPQSKQPAPGRPQSLKGQEGDLCLRSTDCSEGLCCARHFWSKICKPVLSEGQVCTKHKRKGTHNLELFQRCDCADGLSCRTQKGDPSSNSSRSLHTCQRH
uniref:Dickkopf WNT signaling pathway inhibitor 1b n=1 Tax=Scleropages formosus TaxID=113540 RepID=A0A8C9V2L2_SCLFO